jgi:hypothetical protein
MEWSKYEHYTWTTANLSKDEIAKKPIENNWYIKQLDPKAELIPYELHKNDYNPSAELARVYENVMKTFKNPPEDYALMCAKKMFVETDTKGLSETKQTHNAIHGNIKWAMRDWISNWGELEQDAPSFYLDHYWQLAEKFYKFYESIKEPTSEALQEISSQVRLHCEVGLQADDDGFHPAFEITPKNLRGFLWMSLAEDYENHWNAVTIIHCAREACTRVFGSNVRNDKTTCGSSCRNALNRNPKAIATSSLFKRRDV